MKLKEEDFDIHKCNEKEWYYYISQKNPKQVISQILENQEKAEKWDYFKPIYDKTGQENNKLKKDLEEYKLAATAEAGLADNLQKQNRELQEIVEKMEDGIGKLILFHSLKSSVPQFSHEDIVGELQITFKELLSPKEK